MDGDPLDQLTPEARKLVELMKLVQQMGGVSVDLTEPPESEHSLPTGPVREPGDLSAVELANRVQQLGSIEEPRELPPSYDWRQEVRDVVEQLRSAQRSTASRHRQTHQQARPTPRCGARARAPRRRRRAVRSSARSGDSGSGSDGPGEGPPSPSGRPS